MILQIGRKFEASSVHNLNTVRLCQSMGSYVKKSRLFFEIYDNQTV